MSIAGREERAAKIRRAFEEPSNVEVIPADPIFEEKEKNRIEKVGVYCRVSTKQESQTESFEVQKAKYEEMVKQHPNWELVKIYPDEGISATSMKNRKQFLAMLEDCKAGKLTLIITKAVNRFARNTVDCVATCRMLKNLPQPVAVYFETVNLNTRTESSELLLTLLASVAQEESDGKSSSMKWAIRSRFDKGIPRIVQIYGYDKVRESDGRITLVPNQDAWVVKVLYDMVEEGHSLSELLKYLKDKGIPSPKHKAEWTRTSLFYILTNERYCGDVLMQKTFRVDLFTHKSVKNTGQLTQYRSRDYHEAIVPRKQWEHVQQILGVANPFGAEIIEGPFTGYKPLIEINQKENHHV